ncbi:hypothetical protein PoB_000280300 [Plakobranchus ocellatus]|uniref:Uncharacterized protein n=1 Tax=Plakobranchus ocellatus TaxID=259542 RepID=A0AAV3Y236_9GAST|nr:hypothetical protein PoB_000280300 [Plakobranchus ocellatus]
MSTHRGICSQDNDPNDGSFWPVQPCSGGVSKRVGHLVGTIVSREKHGNTRHDERKEEGFMKLVYTTLKHSRMAVVYNYIYEATKGHFVPVSCNPAVIGRVHFCTRDGQARISPFWIRVTTGVSVVPPLGHPPLDLQGPLSQTRGRVRYR